VKVRNKDLTLEDLRALQHAVPAITSVTPIFMSNSEVKSGGKSASTRVFMTDETWIEQNGVDLASGRNFVPSDTRLGSKVAIVGPRVLEKLGLKGNPVGRILSTPTLSLEIIGVLEEQGASLGQDNDDMIAIPITTGLAQLGDAQRRQLFFQARIDPKVNVDDGADMIKDALRRIKGVKAKEREGFLVRSLKQVSGMIDTITASITAVAGGMVSIALLVGGIGIMNIMMVSVTERTREIGVRKAVGAKRKDILFQFLIEAALLSLAGGTVGILLGYAAGAILGKALLNQVGSVPLWAILAGFGVPALIGLVFGLYPAAKASKLDPIESLRYE
jgi:putative ABC transport system permease protein